MFAEKRQTFQQKITEINRIESLQTVLIGFVQRAGLAICIASDIALGHLVCRPAAIFPAVDDGCELACGPAFFINISRFDDLLHQPDLVIRVENGEIRFQAGKFGMPPQQFDADRVKCAKPWHALDRATDKPANPLFHFAGGLVGKGHRQDLAGMGLTGRQNMANAGGQNPGFSGSCAGQHQKWPLNTFHRIALFGVQSVQIGCHRACRCSALAGPRSQSAGLGRMRRNSRFGMCGHDG